MSKRVGDCPICGTVEVADCQGHSLGERHGGLVFVKWETPAMSPTVALYAFWDWMCDDPAHELIGGGHHGAHLRNQLAMFCEVNDLPYLEDGWDKDVKYPERSSRTLPKERRHDKGNGK